MTSVVMAYKLKHGHPLRLASICCRHQFSKQEREGFSSAMPPKTQLVGVRIKQQDDVRLFRPSASMLLLRGPAPSFSSTSVRLEQRPRRFTVAMPGELMGVV